MARGFLTNYILRPPLPRDPAWGTPEWAANTTVRFAKSLTQAQNHFMYPEESRIVFTGTYNKTLFTVRWGREGGLDTPWEIRVEPPVEQDFMFAVRALEAVVRKETPSCR